MQMLCGSSFFFFSFFAWLSSEDFLLASLIERKDFL